MTTRPTAYWDYIKVEEVLSLQGGLAGDDRALSNDEVMFITIHQIDELWFKLLLRELVSARDLFVKVPVPEQSLASAVRGVDRMTSIMRLASDHFALMETLTTRDYLSFRDKLNPASGFQSAQLREIEILAGMDESDRIPLGHEKSYMEMLRAHDGGASSASRRVEARLADKPTLRDAVHEWLYRTPIQASTPSQPDDPERVRAFLESYCEAHAASAREAMSYALRTSLSDADRERLEAATTARSRRRASLSLRRRAPEAERATVAHPRGAGLHRELSRAPAPRVAARSRRRPRGLRAVVRAVPPAPRAHGRARDRASHGHRRLGGRRLPRPDRASLQDLPGHLGGSHAARTTALAASNHGPGVLRLRGRRLDGPLTRPTHSLLISH